VKSCIEVLSEKLVISEKKLKKVTMVQINHITFT